MNSDAFSPSRDDGYSSMANDAHFRQEAEDERRAILKCAQQSARLESMGLLAGGVAHDFNNLLTAILGYIDLAKEEMTDRPNAMALMENAANAGKRARDLCAQILNHVRKGAHENNAVDLHLLITDATSMMKASSKRLDFHLALCAVPSITDGSVVELRQILLNLLINASEAMEDGGNIWIDTNHVHIEKRDRRRIDPGDYIEVRVRDDGHGMPPEVKVRIFEAFYTTKPNGTGIGLASVGRIMTGHGGSVDVESTVGIGTTFTLLFPLANAGTLNTPNKPHWTGTGRILVVDDEKFLAESIARVLSSVGFTVDIADGGAAALALFNDADEPYVYVAAMLDLTMPGMHGEETLKALREAGMKAPVILMSGLERGPALYWIPPSEYSSYLMKPFASQGIISAIRAVVEPSHALDAEPANS